MVRVLDEGIVDLVIVVFADEEDVARGCGPFEGEQIMVARLCVSSSAYRPH